MSVACQPVGRPFKCARKVENRQRCLEIEFAAQHYGRERALGGISGVLGVDELANRGERILGIVTPQNLSQSMGLLNQSRRMKRVEES